MKKSIVEMILEFIRQVRRSKRWQRAVTCVAALVVFVTTYALILPAITMEGNHPRLASEKLAGWAGDAMSVNVSAESPAGSGEKVVVLTAESVSAGLSEEYEFDAEGVAVIEDKMGQEIRLHRTVRENTEDTVDYWFVLAAGQKTEFTLDLQDEIVVDDVIASAGIVENVRTNKKEEAEKASASDAAKVEETEVAAVVTEATASNAAKKSAEKATASNTSKASASNADVAGVDVDEETGEINDGAVINDLDVSDIDQETEVTATLKLNAGMGDDLEEAIRDAEKNAEKRGYASLEFRWKSTVNTEAELTWAANGVNVTMFYNASAEIPDGAYLSVVEIEKDSEEYKNYYAGASAAVNDGTGEKVGLASARFFDITLCDSEGNEIQPATPVVVKINYDDAVELSEEADVKAVHFAEEGAQVLDAVAGGSETTLNEVAFSADGFSVYGIFGTEAITIEHIDHKGTKYEVTVTFGPEANIPAGSSLSVTDIEEGTEEYEYARNAVLADKQAKGEEVILSEFGFAALDISILNPAGEEIEPAAPVQVEIKIKSLPNVENLDDVADSIEIQHHVEAGDKVVVDTVYDGGATEAKFDVVTNEEALAEGTAIDPNSVNSEDYNPQKNNLPESVDLSFETGAFSTYSISWGTRSYNIHYVDTNGNSLTPTMTPSYTNRDRFLIYDIEGYEYDSTHLSSRTGTAIRPYIENYNSDRIYQTTDGDWYYLRNDIYVVYKAKKTPSQGGTPKVDEDETWPEGNDAPQFGKSSVNNVNGTNTITLTIKGGEKPVEKSSPADVIVVFDVSGSMDETMSGQTRLARAKTAVNKMADSLLKNSGVRMALISFSTDAQEVQGFTNNSTTFKNKVTNLKSDGGTNWEKALKLANEMEVRSDAATFVVFVTDGDPTFRVSRGKVSDSNLDMYYSNQNEIYTYYMSDNVFGEGNDDSDGRNFDFAVDQVEAIAGANKSFYAIGISNDVTKVQKLTTDGGVDADHAFIASDSTAMENAFKAITESISSVLGFGNVKINDGITSLTNSEMAVMQEVDPDSFTYYRYGGEGNKYGADEAHMTEWTTREEDGCAAATYDKAAGSVKWNMGETFQLEDGVTYVVQFRVWPKQEAYDLVAALNNGTKVYEGGHENSITDAERTQVVENKKPGVDEDGNSVPGDYALKTNTDQINATYNKTTESGGVVTVSDTHDIDATYHEGDIDNMSLESVKLTIIKTFEDDLTAGEDRDAEVTLIMKRNYMDSTGEDAEHYNDYPVPQSTGASANIKLNESNNWKYEVYVAPGLIVDDEILEHGYTFTVTEPDIDYHYDLIQEFINPMMVNGDAQWIGDVDGNTSLSAINRVKSGIDITKHVYDTDGITEIYPDTEFTITGQLIGPDGQPYTWHDGDSVDASGAYHKYDKDGNRIVYKGHFADSSNISFTLKAGESVRFINVPQGCTFQFTESTAGMDAQGYEWKSTEALTQHRVSPGGDWTQEGDVQPVVSKQTVSLNGENSVVGNKQYAITYKNQRTISLPDIELIKVDQDDRNKKLNGAEFAIHKDSVTGDLVTTDGNGNPIKIETGNKEGSTGPDGWYHIGLLPAGTYYLVETAEPDNYVPDETPIIITVTKGSNSYTVTATKGGESVLSGPTDGLYTITVDNEINLTEAEATKAWKNADGSTTAPSGASVVYTLYADGEATQYTVTLDGTDDDEPEGTAGYESEGWTATFVNLPKYKFDNGEKTTIVYTVKETTTYPGYTASTTDPVANGGSITNTQEATTVDATKAWKNADGSTDAPEGATVVYTLYADGASLNPAKTVILDGKKDETVPTGTAGYESEAWKAMFQNLPKYQNGTTTEIVYTIAETTTYPGYTKSPGTAVASGETITNTQGATEISVEKKWKNANGSAEAPSGATVEFKLYADGKATEHTVTLDGTVDDKPTGVGYESESWKATFRYLPKQKIVDGAAVDIVYTIAETKGYPGYTANTTEPVASGSTITNSQDTTTANAFKAWVNADGTTDAPQGGQVTYTLYADGDAKTCTVMLDGTVDTAPEVTGGYEIKPWKAEFVNLPKYQAGTTTEIVYTIAETTTYPGYTASTTDPVASGGTITNTQEFTEVNATKVWKNADGTIAPPAGATVEFNLYADGAPTEYKVKLDGNAETTEPTVTGGYENEAWKVKFVKLPKYKVVEGEAKEIKYTIGESQGYAGYTATPATQVESGKSITNSQDEVTVYASKVWQNADGTDTAPVDATVEFTLFADGEVTNRTVKLDGTVDETIPEVTGGYESEAWKAAFVHLPKYKVDGKTPIVYTIAETTGYKGYKASTTESVASGGTITNSQVKTVIQIKKIGDWTAETMLSGVEFKLFTDKDCTKQMMADSTGKKFGTDGIITTGSDGTVTIGALIPGTYYLQEVKTADGYNLLDEVVEFTVNDDGNITYSTGNVDFNAKTGDIYRLEDGGYGIYINNPSGKVLPHTGGRGTLLFRIAGLALMLMGAAYVSYDFETRRRRERRLKK